MSATGTQFHIVISLQHQDGGLLGHRTLKRKLGPSAAPGWPGARNSYPSPPMSGPPSPSKAQSELSHTTTAGPPTQDFRVEPVTTSAPIATTLSSLPPTLYGSTIGALAPNAPAAVPFSTHRGHTTLPPIQQPVTAPSVPAPNPIAGPSYTRGRKSKAHVASACVNCKRAHLSCDVNRPCARCVASGKQVSFSLVSADFDHTLTNMTRTHATMSSTRSAVGRGYAKTQSLRLRP